MLRCRNLSLADGATTEGSLVTAAKLLAQLRNELSASPSDAFRVGFRDAAAARAWCYPGEGSDEGSMWQSGDEITVEGLQLFIVHDRVVDAYKLAHNVDSVSEATATAWAQSIADPDLYTPDSTSDIPVLNHLVFWSCPECKEGSFPDILPNGTIRGHYFLGTIRGAFKSNPSVAFAGLWLALGLGNCVASDTEGLALVQNKEIFGNTIAGLSVDEFLLVVDSFSVQTYIGDRLIKTPHLVQLVSKYDILEFLESTGTQWIDTGYYPNFRDLFEIKFQTTKAVNYPYPFDLRDSASIRFETYIANNGIGALGFNICYDGAKNSYGTGSSITLNVIHTIIRTGCNSYTQDGINCTFNASPDADYTYKSTLSLFGNPSLKASTESLFYGRIYYYKVPNRICLIPCRRKSDNVIGMFDIVSGRFCQNTGTGEFSAGPVSCNSFNEVFL